MGDTEGERVAALRAVLRRHATQYQPADVAWGSIEARRAGVLRAPVRGWRRLQGPGLVAAALLVLAVIVAQTRGAPRVQFVQGTAGISPAYASVPPVPTFLPGTTMAAIQARGYLRAGVKFDQPGFGFQDPTTGVVQGFDIEIVKLMAAAIFGGNPADLGARIHYVEAPSKDREALLSSGQVDLVVATYTINAGRQALVSFAGPYFQARQDIMVAAGETAIHGVADLDGRKVCTVRGSTSYQNLVRDAPGAQVLLEDSYSQCAQALSRGTVAAVTTDDTILAGLAHQSGLTFKLVHSPFSEEPYGIGLHKGDEAFRAFLDARLADIEADGDWQQAANYSLEGIETFLPPPLATP